MTSLHKIVVATLAFSTSVESMELITNWLNRNNNEPDTNDLALQTQTVETTSSGGVHIHNYPANKKKVDKKAAFIAVGAVLTNIIGTGFNTVGIASNTPSYQLIRALPANNSVDPSLYQYEIFVGQCSDRTIQCSPNEVGYYDDICDHHYQQQFGYVQQNVSTQARKTARKLIKRYFNELHSQDKRFDSTAKYNGTCTKACATTDNVQECMELAIRDNAIKLKECNGQISDGLNLSFGSSVGAFFTNLISMGMIVILGIKASGVC